MDSFWDFAGTWIDVYEQSRAAAEEIEEDERERAEEGVEPEPAEGDDVLDEVAEKNVEELKKALEEAEQGNPLDALEMENLDEEGRQELLKQLEEMAKGMEPEERAALELLQKQLREQLELPEEEAEGEVVPPTNLELGLPEDDNPNNNPLLQELGGDQPKEPQKIEIEIDGEKVEVEIDGAELMDEFEFEEEGGAFGGPFAGLLSLPEAEVMRSWLDKLRMLRGIRYHRWLEEDGVPRSSTRIRLAR